jgi:hypothetical protein
MLKAKLDRLLTYFIFIYIVWFFETVILIHNNDRTLKKLEVQSLNFYLHFHKPALAIHHNTNSPSQ